MPKRNAEDEVESLLAAMSEIDCELKEIEDRVKRIRELIMLY